MSQDSFVFNFNVNNFSGAAQDFPKSNVVELEGSKWYLGIEKALSADQSGCKHLNIFFTCERGNANGIYTANLALILRGSLIDLLFTKTHYFEPLDLEMSCFKIDCGYIFDKDNGFINGDGGCEIMADISVTHFATQEEVAGIDPFYGGSLLPPKDCVGIINLQGGYSVHVNKKLLSSHSEYFDNLFNNPHFDESSQESIDLTAFTYKQFRLLHKHIYHRRYHYLYEVENVEDLLCLGSYFQIAEILESCEEFLRRNYGSRSLMELAEKYNLKLLDIYSLNPEWEPSMDGDSRSSSHGSTESSFTEILVHINFLDSGKNEMCSVHYENFMSIQELLSVALTNLYSDGICDCPSKYTPAKVRIAELATPFSTNRQRVYEGESSVFTTGSVYISKTYSFEVRRKVKEAWRGETGTEKDDYSTSKEPSMDGDSASSSHSSTKRSFTEIMESSMDGDSASSSHSSTKRSFTETMAPTEVLAQLIFPISEAEKMCTISYKAGMSVKELYFEVFTTLKYLPSQYEIESVHVSNLDSALQLKPRSLDIRDIEINKVNSSHIYSFRLKQKTDEPTTSKES
ncbi:BTB/POZ domain-containing protein [Ditylenchus destructor]|nr:BTB/POZ domain-containing protein [Ditylenchus destructor]